MRYKVIFTILLIVSIVFCTFKPAKAALVSIRSDGDVLVNVLPANIETDELGEIAVQKIEGKSTYKNAHLTLRQESGNYILILTDESGEKSLEVKDFEGDIVTFEERPQVKSLSIAVSAGKFVLKDSGVSAETNFEIGIDPKNAKLFVNTLTGSKYITILPAEASKIALQSKIFDYLDLDAKNTIDEVDEKVAYTIRGEKIINFFNVYYYTLPIAAQVSAVDGVILGSNEPMWVKILGIFLT